MNFVGYTILLNKLIEARKAGRLKKSLAKLMVQRLKKRGIPINPELLDIVLD